MKVRILLLTPEMCVYGKHYLMVANQESPEDHNAIISRPAVLQYLDGNEWFDVEVHDVLEFEQSGVLRAVPTEVQVPVYPEATRGGEERGSEPGDHTASGSGELHEEGDPHTTH